MSMLQMSILGRPIIRWNGHEVETLTGRARALLFRLAAQSEPLPREHLGFLFWPDQSEDGMRRNVTRLCNRLQNILPINNALIIGDDGVGLNMSLVWSDAILFHQLAADYNHHPRLILLCALVDLYRGPFLDGYMPAEWLEYSSWITVTRKVWQRDYLAALQTLVEQSMIVGDTGRAIAMARRYLAVDETDETIHRHLIELYGLSGEQIAAQKQYDTCAEVLRRRHGRNPSAVTDSACRSAMAGRLDNKEIGQSFTPHLAFADQKEGRRRRQYEPKPRRQKILLF